MQVAGSLQGTLPAFSSLLKSTWAVLWGCPGFSPATSRDLPTSCPQPGIEPRISRFSAQNNNKTNNNVYNNVIKAMMLILICAHTDLLPALGGEEMTRTFLQEVSNILWAFIRKSNQRNSKVHTFILKIYCNYKIYHNICMYQAVTGCFRLCIRLWHHVRSLSVINSSFPLEHK